MKAITFSVLMLALALPGFAQTPAGPVGPAAQPQPAAPPETATPAPGGPGDQRSGALTHRQRRPTRRSWCLRIRSIPMILNNTINTRSAYVGEAIYCESIYPITVGNHIIIPKGSSIRGTVTEVIRPGRVKGRAQLGPAV